MEGSKALLVALAFAVVLELGLVGANFYDWDVKWEPQNAKISGYGNHLSISLFNKTSGCLVQTKRQFIYGSVSVQMKLVRGNSAGTVTTLYTSSTGPNHDEIDFEFLGNQTSQPYIIHTNVFAGGVGKREMQFRPWFDPTTGFHNYTIFWDPCMIVWFIDGIPIRVVRNYENKGIAFPTRQPMNAFASIWSGEDWETQGGRVKTDLSQAPFVAEYENSNMRICECYHYSCAQQCAAPANWYASPEMCRLSYAQMGQLRWVQSGYTIYNYCDKTYNGQKPPECYLPQY